MAKFNNTYFGILCLLLILDQSNAKRRGGIFAIFFYSDGQAGVSGLEVVFIVIGVLVLLVSIVSCCLKCANLFEDEEEKTQEAPSQLESGLHNGLNKPSNDFVLNTEPAPNAPYPPSVAGAPTDCWQVPQGTTCQQSGASH